MRFVFVSFVKFYAAFILIVSVSAYTLMVSGSAYILMESGSANIWIVSGSAYILIVSGSAYILIVSESAYTTAFDVKTFMHVFCSCVNTRTRRTREHDFKAAYTIYKTKIWGYLKRLCVCNLNNYRGSVRGLE